MKRNRKVGHRGFIPAAVILALALAMPLVLGAGALAANSDAGYPESVAVSLEFPDLEVTDNGDGTQGLFMQGYPSVREAGLPALPSRVLAIALPPGAEASAVTIEGENWYALPGTYTVEWGQPALSCDEDPEQEPIQAAEPDPEVYSSDSAYPEASVILTGTGAMRAISIAEVEINPVRYYPQSRRIEVLRSLTLRVDTQAGTMPGPDDLASSPFDATVAETLENFDQARPWYERAREAAEPKLSEGGDAADYMIITAEALASAVEPLKAYKESQGLSVQVVTQEWISANCSGIDEIEKTRNFLKDNYASLGMDYVLLVGTHDALPMRECYVETFRLYPFEIRENWIPTDYYYSDLSGDWDLNDDGVYGQPGIDDKAGGVDYFPEVYVGRIPTDDAVEVTGICQKIANFSEDTGDWKHKALLIGAVFNYFLEINSILPTYGSQFAEKAKGDILRPLGFSVTTMYEKGGLAPDPALCDQSLLRENVLMEWPKGYGVVSIHCHGSSTSGSRKVWITDDGDGIPEESEMDWTRLIGTSDCIYLDDTHPSIVYSQACSNANPNYYNSMMAALLRNGASATVGSSRTSYYTAGWINEYMGLDQSMNYMFFKYLLMEGYSVGKALRMTDVWMKNNCDWWGGFNRANLYNFNLFGDPSMTLDASGDPAIIGVNPAGAWNLWPVNLTVGGSNFRAGATVTLRMEGQSDITATQVNVNSPTLISCTFNITDAAAGKWDVVVENPDGSLAVLEDGFVVNSLCGTGGGSAALALGLSLGLLYIAGWGGLLRRRHRKR
jgi:hypothetical protein